MHAVVETKIKNCLACGQPLKNPYDEFFRDDNIPVDADLGNLFGNLWRNGGKNR